MEELTLVVLSIVGTVGFVALLKNARPATMYAGSAEEPSTEVDSGIIYRRSGSDRSMSRNRSSDTGLAFMVQVPAACYTVFCLPLLFRTFGSDLGGLLCLLCPCRFYNLGL